MRVKTRSEKILDVLKEKIYLTTQGNLRLKDKILTVAFKHPYGIKKLMKNHKSISKVSVS